MKEWQRTAGFPGLPESGPIGYTVPLALFGQSLFLDDVPRSKGHATVFQWHILKRRHYRQYLG